MSDRELIERTRALIRDAFAALRQQIAQVTEDLAAYNARRSRERGDNGR